MRLLELFAGYGSQRKALNRLGIFPETAISEIDKYAIQAYEQLHGPTKNYGDISKIEEIDDRFDMWTYSFPCQDLSQAGKQAGIKEGTRSGLLFEVERLLRKAVESGNEPTYLLLENVRALVSKKFKPDFDRWLECLSELGYDNYWKILNAKDFGVPQNRERVFVVSIKRGAKKGYEFPLPFPLKRKLKDVLEKNVDEKYYLPDEKAGKLLACLRDSDVSRAIRCGGRGSVDVKHTWDVVLIGGEQKHQAVKTDGVSTCLTSSMGTGGGYVPIITDPVIAASRGRNPENPSDRRSGIPTEQRLEVNNTGCSNTLTTVQKDNYIVEPVAYDEQNQYIRRDDCVGTLTTDGSSPKHNNRIIEPKVMQVGNIVSTGNWDNPQRGRIYSSEGCCPALNCCQGGGLEPKIIEDFYHERPPREYEGYAPTLRADRYGLKVVQPENSEGIGHHPFSKKFEFNGFHKDGACPTLLSTDYKCPKCYSDGYRIRKLTPHECWRLMGVSDEDYEKLHDISNSQLYKMAGNSIVVDVLYYIFKNLLEE